MANAITEFGLIAKHFAPLATHPGALALTDDACVLKQEAGQDLIVTSDALTAGVHFLPDDPPNLIASKALRVNLSDLAAKGAEPLGYLLALALPQSTDDAWLAEFARGLGEDQRAFGVSLLGGDTTATPGPLTIAITALGTVPAGAMIRRTGARAGDCVFVSGTIGDAGAGLTLLQDGKAANANFDWAYLVGRYQQPTPRLRLGRSLRGVATASLDVSDGLLADLGHIAAVSGVRIVVEADLVPRSEALRRFDPDGVVRAVTAGDDYEIAFTAAPDVPVQGETVPVIRIGRVEPGQGVVLVDGQGREIPITRTGFTHF